MTALSDTSKHPPQPTQGVPLPTVSPCCSRWMLVGLFLLALTLRAGWGLYRFGLSASADSLEFPDEQQYWLIATNFASGEGLKDEMGFRAGRMPFYPMLLSACTATPWGVVAARIVQWIVGALAAPLGAVLGARLFGCRTGLLAGLAVACDPFFIFFSSLLLTETVSLVAVLWLWLVATPLWLTGSSHVGSVRQWLLLGVASAVAIHTRESNAGLVLLLLLLLVIRAVPQGVNIVRRRTGGVVLTGVVVVLSLFPWAWRNQAVTGEWCWLTMRSGISLYDGVRPNAQGDSDLGDIKQMDAVKGLSEPAWNRYFMHESRRIMTENPARIVNLFFQKIARMWNPWPNVTTYQSPLVRLISAGWMFTVYTLLGAAIILLARRHTGYTCVILFLLLPAVYFTMLHGLFVGSVRYRLVAMPMLEILAAYALTQGVSFIEAKTRSSYGTTA